MSKAEIQRFAADLRSDPALRKEVQVKGALPEHDVRQGCQRLGACEVTAVSNVVDALVCDVDYIAGHKCSQRIDRDEKEQDRPNPEFPLIPLHDPPVVPSRCRLPFEEAHRRCLRGLCGREFENCLSAYQGCS